MAKNDGKTGFLSEGSKVEVAIDGAWYEAYVVTDSNDQLGVVSPDRKLRSVNRSSVRPRPPPPSADPSYEPRDVVDVLDSDGWWKGVVSGVYKLEGKASYTVVFFANPPDYADRIFTCEELRFHWVWTPDGQWVRPPKPMEIPGLGGESSTSAGNENQNGFLSEGSPVEVKYEGAWYEANILKKCPKSKDQFSVSCRRRYYQVNVLNISISSIRPHPPPPAADQSYEQRHVVDVFYYYGWWKGVVSGVYMLNAQTSYAVALFKTPPYSGLEDNIFTSEEMRFHWDWTLDGKWVRPSTSEISGLDEQSLALEKSKPVTGTSGRKKLNTPAPETIETLSNNPTESSKENPVISSAPEESRETPKAMKSTSDLGENLVVKNRAAKTSKKRPREVKSYITNQKALAAGNTDDDSAKVTRNGNFDQSSKVYAQAQSEIVRKEDLPFTKSSYLWKEIDSLEVFRVLPQSPHFSPLMDCNEDTREGMAMGHIWNFASLVEKVSKLQIEDPKSLFERYLEALAVLETIGFDVKAVVDRVNELLAFKTKQEQLAVELSSLKDMFNVKAGASW